MENKTCKDCDNFTGCGDWDLCCTNPPEDKVGWCGFLCYEDTEACENFKPLRHIKFSKREVDWSRTDFPLHTGEHSQ